MPTITSAIEKKQDVCGGDACIRGTRIPVWVIVDYRRRGLGDEGLLRFYPTLTPADLEAAWHYASANAEEIDLAIRENDRVDDDFVE